MLSVTINITWRTIMGVLFIGIAVAISSLGIGRAEHVMPNTKVYNCSTGTACLTGNSTGSKTFGIYAEGTSYDALHAVTSTTSGNSAISGISTGSSGNGNGVYGRSSNGDGVHGSSSTANGVYGVTTTSGGSMAPLTAGVYGTSSTTDGVYGFTSAVQGRSLAGVFGEATGNIGSGVYGRATSSGGGEIGVIGEANGGGLGAEALLALSDGDPYIFIGYDNQTGKECTIDPDANLTCSGKISGAGPMLMRQRTDVGRRVLTYAAQAATPTIEDLGAAQMHDGTANVEVPADFASVIDRSNPYYVFLTPMGDTHGLYVSTENAAGFQVRENMRGRSNVTFQYRIIGVPLGAKNVRLPIAPEMKAPRLAKVQSSTR